MAAATLSANRIPDPQVLFRDGGGETIDTTLLELIQAVSEVTDDDREIIATVLHLLHSRRVRLVGTLRGEMIPDAA